MVINQNHYIRLNLLQTIWQTCICVYISWKISITYFKAWFKLTLVCVHCLQLLPIVSLLFWLYNEASIFKILNLVADRFTAKAKLTGSQYEERQTVPLFHSHILCSLHLLYIDKIQKKFFFKMLVLKKKKNYFTSLFEWSKQAKEMSTCVVSSCWTFALSRDSDAVRLLQLNRIQLHFRQLFNILLNISLNYEEKILKSQIKVWFDSLQFHV